MSCEAVEESFVALLDGEIGAAERRVVERHVDGCAACARELRLLQATRTVVTRQLAGAAASPGAGSFEDLWQRVEAAERPLRVIAGSAARPPARRRRTIWAGAGGLALAAGLAALVVGLPRQEPSPLGVLPPAPAAVQPSSGEAHGKAASREGSRVAAKAPAKESAQVAKRAPAGAHPEQVAEVANEEVANEIDPPRELLERPELFINYPVVRKLDELRHLEAVLAEPSDEGGAG